MKQIVLSALIAVTAITSAQAQILQIDPIYVGGDATFNVNNGSPFGISVICYSTAGPGPFTLSNGLTLDLSTPIRLLSSIVLDANGSGQLGPLPVPSRAVPGMQVWFQAAHVDSLNPWTVTNMVPAIVGAVGVLDSWGYDSYGQVLDTPTSNDFTQVATGAEHSVALKSDGSLVSWGYNADGQVSDTPTTNDFIQVVGGGGHSLALKSDGSLVSWGYDYSGEVLNTPTTNDFTQVAAGSYHSFALKSDGSLVSWGLDSSGQVSNTPTTNDFTQVSTGHEHSVALQSDGSLVSWGSDSSGQVSNTPTTNGFTQVSAGHEHSVALKQ
jgi:N6-adenosine-specific RNA methylase IME4